MASKDPAFLFYSSDFLTGTMFMSHDQVGRYIRLLCAQHQRGRLSREEMLAIAGEEDPQIFEKFLTDETGRYYNERLESEMIRRRTHSEKQRARVSKRWAEPAQKEPIDTAVLPDRYQSDTGSIPLPGNTFYSTETENETISKEGGMGGGFSWDTARRSFLASDPWKIQFMTAKKIGKEALEESMRVFIQDIELRAEFKPLKELYGHFTNWYNKNQKDEKNRRSYTSTKPTFTEQLATSQDRFGDIGNLSGAELAAISSARP